MDNSNLLYQQLKTLKDELDTITYLEIKHAKDSAALASVAIQKSKVVQEIATIVMANELSGKRKKQRASTHRHWQKRI
ncbi:hypothetical protein NHP20013_12570 [Helicobacter bizzozeronii]|nr:hypothetical protein NHP20013_12570 [Helicobacter bizzozeronii]